MVIVKTIVEYLVYSSDETNKQDISEPPYDLSHAALNTIDMLQINGVR